MSKSKLLLIVIILSGLIARLFYLHQFPIGITNDELEFTINAQALFETGSDVTGTWKPWQLTSLPNAIPGLPVNLIAPIIGFFGLNLFTARLPIIFFMTLNSILIYFLVKQLTNKNKLGLLASLIFNFNPWVFHFSRTVYDPSIFIFFWLAGTYLLLTKKNYLSLLSLPLFIFGFHSYVGTKVIFLPLVIIPAFYAFKVQKSINKRSFSWLVLLSSLFFFLWLAFSLPKSSMIQKQQQFVFFDQELIAETRQKHQSWSLPSITNRIAFSRPVLVARLIIEKYLDQFSIQYLFISGDTQPGYSFWIHGPFYLIEIISIIFGSLYLFHRRRSLFYFLFSLILIVPLPASLITSRAYAVRSSLLFPFLVFLSAFGFYYLFLLIKPRLLKLTLIVIYAFSIFNFLHLYFFRYPVYAPHGFNYHERILNKYLRHIQTNNPDKKIYIFSSLRSQDFLNEYYFYNNDNFSLSKLKQEYQHLPKNYFNHRQVTFTQDIDQIFDPQAIYIISVLQVDAVDQVESLLGLPSLAIAHIVDPGIEYFIYNDQQICTPYSIERFPRPQHPDDFNLEKFSYPEFCLHWIAKL
jgi:4-amino-4-deoxy-L-arabinose transferase-like glycosyltransferase